MTHKSVFTSGGNRASVRMRVYPSKLKVNVKCHFHVYVNIADELE